MGKITFENKVPAVGDIPANWTPEMKISADDINEIKLVTNENHNYKSFAGRLTFSGTFGVQKIFSEIGDFTVTNPSEGVVRFTPVTSGVLISNKTLVFLGSGRREFLIEVDYSFIPSFFDIKVYDLENAQVESPSLTMAIEIRVYD